MSKRDLTVYERADLTKLQFRFEHYAFGFDGNLFTARHDDSVVLLTAPSVGELRRVVEEDYAERHPVPEDQA